MSYKHKIVFGSFQSVERQLDELAKSTAKRELDSGELVDVRVLENTLPLGIAFMPAIIQGGAAVTFCAVLTVQYVKDS